MFVLLIGLLGVAAMIPAGRHEILAGVKLDYASMVGRAAFRDMKIREYTDPEDWRDLTAAPNSVFDSTTSQFVTAISKANSGSTLTPVVAIDPLGLASGFTATFPYNAGTLSLTRIYPSAAIASTVPATSLALADPIFRTSDDLILVPNASKDFPPTQQMLPIASPLKRASDGNYSWLATVVTDPTMSALNSKVTISVAVFYKRDLSTAGAGETASVRAIAMPGSGLSGGEVVLYDPLNPTALKLVKPGQWIMMAGYTFSTTIQLNYYRWYRVVAATDVQNITASNPSWLGTAPSDMPGPPYQLQAATLQGADWSAFPATATDPLAALPNTTPWPYVWIFDNVIAVYEKNMRLELD